MAEPKQTFANHARYVPGFHFITGSLVVVNFIWSIYKFYRVPSGFALDGIVVAIILLGLFWYLRAFPLAVQDRLISLEERLRITRLLPPDKHSLADELSSDQLIALRFASDAEFPDLARRVLAENIRERAEIKKLISNWRADHMRA
jgi:hypothetical protein